MDFWLVVIIIIVVWYVLAVINANSPQRKMQNLQQYFDSVHTTYSKVQDKLSKDFLTPYNKEEHWLYNEIEYRENINLHRLSHAQNELCHRHIQTIITSDKYSFEAKSSAVEAYRDYIWSQSTLDDFIEHNLLGEDIDRAASGLHECRNTLIGVMEAFGFDLEKEAERLQHQIDKNFPARKQTKLVKRIIQ